MGNTVDKFVDAIEKLLDSTMIIAGREIRLFLITMTEDEETKEAIRSCSGGYIINDDYKRVVLEHGALPSSDEKKVAFITALLFAVDTKKIDLTDLIKTLYPESDPNDGYSKFLSDFIQPYAESFVNILIGEPVPDVTVTPKPVFDKMNADVTSAVNELVRVVRNAPFSEEIKAEIKFAGNGLLYAITFNDSFLTEVAYRGLINALRLYNIKSEAEKYITSTLKLYGVI